LQTTSDDSRHTRRILAAGAFTGEFQFGVLGYWYSSRACTPACPAANITINLVDDNPC